MREHVVNSPLSFAFFVSILLRVLWKELLFPLRPGMSATVEALFDLIEFTSMKSGSSFAKTMPSTHLGI